MSPPVKGVVSRVKHHTALPLLWFPSMEELAGRKDSFAFKGATGKEAVDSFVECTWLVPWRELPSTAGALNGGAAAAHCSCVSVLCVSVCEWSGIDFFVEIWHSV